MRVLDIGCGAGDVTMLAAELVGASGSVVGIDRNADVIAVARARAQTAGCHHVEFRQGTAEDLYATMAFDAVIGRYVLVH
jgi:ubiquinone/menaquinone biosynthesis C-methylase UbiE